MKCVAWNNDVWSIGPLSSPPLLITVSVWFSTLSWGSSAVHRSTITPTLVNDPYRIILFYFLFFFIQWRYRTASQSTSSPLFRNNLKLLPFCRIDSRRWQNFSRSLCQFGLCFVSALFIVKKKNGWEVAEADERLFPPFPLNALTSVPVERRHWTLFRRQSDWVWLLCGGQLPSPSLIPCE